MEKLQSDGNQLLTMNKKLKEENEVMSEKLKILSESSIVNILDLEDALSVVKMKKEKGSKIEPEIDQSLQKQISAYEAQNVETVNELEKTRNMLILQHRINRDYQAEVEAINQLKIQQKSEYETRLQEYAKLLDIRAARIQKLERQLKDIAYGTKQYQIGDVITDYDMEETVPLERGQNLFELHVDKVTISSDSLHILQDREPCTFLTWNFYDYQMVTTSIVKGNRPEFNHTSQYVVRADDSFLEYILKMKTTIEFHVATGMDYFTLATGQLNLRPILDDTQSRYHGKVQLIGTDDAKDNLVIGTLEFWARLQIPMEQAVRLFKERGKALGYIATNYNTTKSALTILEGQAEADKIEDASNEIHIKILRCSSLTASQEDHQPSPFCVYGFYNTPDHHTANIPASNNPEFNDHNILSIAVNQDLDDFLKTKSLQIFVFDDADPVVNNYIGIAEIPLVSLVRNNAINGTFEVISESEEKKGTMDISIYFQYTYLLPSGHYLTQPIDTTKKNVISSESEGLVFEVDRQCGSKEELSDTIVAGDANMVVIPTAPPRNRKSGPTASSTPVISRTSSIDKPQPSSRALRFSEAIESSSPHKKPKPEAAPRRSSLKSKDESYDQANQGDSSSTRVEQAVEKSSPMKSKLKKSLFFCSSRASPKKSQHIEASPKVSDKAPEELSSDDDSIDSLKEELKNKEVSPPGTSRMMRKESISTSESDNIVVKNPEASSDNKPQVS